MMDYSGGNLQPYNPANAAGAYSSAAQAPGSDIGSLYQQLQSMLYHQNSKLPCLLNRFRLQQHIYLL